MISRLINFRVREKMVCIHLLLLLKRRNLILSSRISRQKGLRSRESLVWMSCLLILVIMVVISYVLIRNSMRPIMFRRISHWLRALFNPRIPSLRLLDPMRWFSSWMILGCLWTLSLIPSKRTILLWIFLSRLSIFLLLEITVLYYVRELYKSLLSVIMRWFSWSEEMYFCSGDQYSAYDKGNYFESTIYFE